jgi:hypothetical protein
MLNAAVVGLLPGPRDRSRLLIEPPLKLEQTAIILARLSFDSWQSKARQHCYLL